MKAKIAVSIAVVGMAIGLVFQFGGADAVAGGEASVAAAGSLSMAALPDKDVKFGGSKKCKMCHSKAYKSWAETAHAKSFDLLKPGIVKEAKVKFKLDPAKDYTTDKSCLACHTTGYGTNGGYAVPDPADEKAVKKMAKLEGVGCESCHGAPGKGYKALKKSIKKEQKKYKFEEMMAVGMIKIVPEICTCCHNKKSPTYDETKAFDFEKMTKDEKAFHAHEVLQYREK